MTKSLFLALALAAAACDQRPPAPTAEQNDQLNEAEEMLNEEAGNQRRKSPEGVESSH
jgi:hypothetical protein